MSEASAAAATGPSDPFRLVGTRLDGKYSVESVVAEGGFAVVYRCEHAELQKTVALKVLKIPSHHGQLARGEFFRKFANEARTIARIEHESIVRVLDFGSSIMPSGDLAPWMALEWLEGRTLQRDLDARSETGFAGRSPAECLALLHPVIEAVALAHEEGVAHRDIKPGNMMLVTNRRGDERLKLLDFGIAKVMTDEERAPTLGQTSTQAHLQMFSLEYAAPEQMSGTRTGPWTDVHALSLVLTEMLTGDQPYEGDDSVEIFSEALSRVRPTPARHGLDVGPWEPVLQRALALRPADRYPDAGSLLKALLAEVPEQAIWREDLPLPAAAAGRPAPRPRSDPPAAAPSSARPAAGAIPAASPPPSGTPAVGAATPESGRITELLPSPPRRQAVDDDEPVTLPVHRLGWAGWLAAGVGIGAVALAVFATQRPGTTARPAPRPAPAVVAPAPAAPAPAVTAPAVVAPAVVAPAVVAPAPTPAPVAAPVAEPAAPPVAAPPPVSAPPSPPAAARPPTVRRSRPPRESGGRIPIE
jgi:serine/threonine protein kinase